LLPVVVPAVSTASVPVVVVVAGIEPLPDSQYLQGLYIQSLLVALDLILYLVLLLPLVGVLGRVALVGRALAV
jgi:hypothetical protein